MSEMKVGRWASLARLLTTYKLLVLADGIIYQISESLGPGAVHKGAG